VARTCVAISSVLLLALTGWAISPALDTARAREALVPLALPVRTNIRVEVVGASVLVGALIIALTFCDLKRAHRWAPAVRSPLRLGIAGEASGHAASRGILPPGPLALLVITVLLVEVIGAGIRVGTLIIALRLLRELQLACRRRWRGRRRRWRRRRRPCAHVTVIPTLPVAVNTLYLGATPGTLAVIGVAAETGTHRARCKRMGSHAHYPHICGFEVRMVWSLTSVHCSQTHTRSKHTFCYPYQPLGSTSCKPGHL